ncbi:hypothetical protein HY404_02240 [Candidatus Microgenomates bacterium]|nr:hypothetical protein [Candidatus Microgenomates bacterium]
MSNRINLKSILIIIATVILAAIAVFTAWRLYQLRSEPVAPTAPKKAPAAENKACSALTFTIATATASPTATPVPCTVTCAQADLNKDNKVTILDLTKLGQCTGKTPTGNCAGTDLNKDNVVDQKDADCVKTVWQQTCSAATASPTASPTSTATARPTATATAAPTSSAAPTATSAPAATATTRAGTAAPTATAAALPVAGMSWPAVVGGIAGVGILILGILLAF